MRQTELAYRRRPEPFSPQMSVAATMSLAVLCWIGVIWFVHFLMHFH